MKKIIIISTLALLLAACSDKNGAQKALDDQGFSNITTSGRPGFLWFFSGCDEKDFYATGFTATNSKGKPITGVVCSGFFAKGNTIRTF